ncbi:MAG: hypothetical protein M0Z64_05760 [Nitrospiraceae bacterium]|nr:hypothetical protein [Nitrospiraceae bacterium]
MEDNRKVEVAQSLGYWCIRTLSDQNLLLKTPGFRPLHLDKQAKGVADFGISIKDEPERILEQYRFDASEHIRKGAHDSSCGHGEGMFGALLAFSPQLGQPPKRNNPTHQITLKLCSVCGALGLLGTTSFQTGVPVSRNGKLTKERYFFMPRFKGRATGDVLQAYIAAVKHVQPRLNSVPANSALLALLSLYPHIGRIIQKHLARPSMPAFFVARADSSGNAPRYQHFEERNIDAELMFLGNNPYNVALAQSAYRHAEDKPELLGFLSKTLQFRQNQDAVSFCREYMSATEGKQLVYKESIKYIAKEVLGMDEKMIDDPNIGTMASMLKFFVSKQKFGYVDNLRGSRTPEEFKKHLLSAHRDAASIYSKPNDKKDKEEKWLYLPNENNVREFLKLLECNFEQVKTLTCLLAFTYWKKEG